MHTVQGWHAEPCKVRCDGAIGQQHAAEGRECVER